MCKLKFAFSVIIYFCRNIKMVKPPKSKQQNGKTREELLMMCIGDIIQVS